MNELNYKDRAIGLVTQQFGNGTAVEVTVDGEVVLDRYDARALYVSEEEALRMGAQFGRDYIDGRPFAVILPANTVCKELLNITIWHATSPRQQKEPDSGSSRALKMGLQGP